MIKSLKDLLDKFSRFTNSLVYDGGICKRLQQKKKKLKTKEQKISEMQNEKMQIIGGIFLMFSQGKITKEELDKVTVIGNDLSTLESKNKENE